MNRTTLLFSLLLCISFTAHTQDMGYRTMDAGAAYQWHPDGSAYDLHLAFNAKIHHSLILFGGYEKAPSKKTDKHDSEEGSGWSLGAGYRYYFSVLPKRFFLGARMAYKKMTIHWSMALTESNTKLTLVQPSLEAGYTFLINDLFFITPSVAAGTTILRKTAVEDVAFEKGFVPLIGISAGWRF